MLLPRQLFPFAVVFLFILISPGLFSQTRTEFPSPGDALSYEELVDLALEYGLETRGNRLVLEERLRDILNSVAPEREVIPSSEEPLASVEASDAGNYLRGDRGDELELQGNVIVVVKNDEQNITHTISADLIRYNQELDQLSAEGNVSYTMKGESREDQFSGNSLLFVIAESESLFIGGEGRYENLPTNDAASIAKELRGAGEVEYFYTGEFISRNQENAVIMDKGFITSSQDPSPNYRITFDKLWVLSPGEWGIEEAGFYVGNIPFFAFPFFYLPGNEIVFNPVFLYDDIRGYGLNTTTYLVGKKTSDSSSPLSFLQLTDNETASSYSSLGIFLQPENSPAPENPAADVFDTFKLYADIYSVRGFSLGLSFDFKPSEVIDSSVLALFSLTREIYTSLQGEVTSRYNTEQGETTSTWHESNLAGITLPFRFILDLQLSLSASGFNFRAALPVYSDPYINGEFNTRSENIPWDTLILGGTSGAQDLNFASNRMNWDIIISFTPTLPDFFRPLLSSVSLRNITSRFVWDRKSVSNLPNEHSTAISSPERQKFVPKQIQLLSGTASLSGKILQFPLPPPTPANDPSSNELPDDLDDFLFPYSSENTSSNTEAENPRQDVAEEEFASPTTTTNLPTAANNASSYSLAYSASNTHFLAFFFENFTDEDYETSHSKFQDDINISLTQDVNILQSFVSLQNRFNYSASLREAFAFSDKISDTVKTNLSQQEKKRERQSITLRNNSTLNLLAPFYTNLRLSLTHTINLEIWKWSNDGLGNTTDDIFEWDTDHVSSHQVSGNFSLPLFGNMLRQDFTATYILPPLEESLRLGYSLAAGPVSSSLGFNFKSENDSLEPEQLTWNTTLSLLDELQLKSNLRWLFEPEITTDELGFELKAFWYTGNLSFRTRRILTLNSTKNAWIRSDDEEFRLSNMQHRLNIPLDIIDTDEVLFNTTLNTRWNHDFVQFTSSRINFDFSLNLRITNFLALKLSVNSVNNSIYRYFPDYASQLNILPADFFQDLFDSFNLFDNAARERSRFNLESISFQLLHDLEDWVLRLDFSWLPKIVTENGIRSYQLENKLSFFLQWLPIEEFSNEIDFDIVDDKWTVQY